MKRHEETTSTKNLNSFSSAFRKVLVVTCRKGKRVLVPSAYFHTQSGLSQLQPCHAVQTQASPLSWPPGKFASHNCSRFSISNIRLSKGSQQSVAGTLLGRSTPFIKTSQPSVVDVVVLVAVTFEAPICASLHHSNWLESENSFSLGTDEDLNLCHVLKFRCTKVSIEVSKKYSINNLQVFPYKNGSKHDNPDFQSRTPAPTPPAVPTPNGKSRERQWRSCSNFEPIGHGFMDCHGVSCHQYIYR